MTGRLVIMGSGEVAPTMVGTHRAAIEATGAAEVVILDTTFGFQENAAQLTARLVEFFETSLRTPAHVASLPSLETDPVDVERFRDALRTARVAFAGPGSPSYALSVWRAFEVGPLLTDVIVRGGAVTLASAAALTAGTRTIPVYEIYKAGEDPHWLEGLDLLAAFGVSAAVVPHWNNTEGGNHDTSRCYIGERRLSMLEQELEHGIIGIDEHTALTVDGESGKFLVTGRGAVTLRGARHRVIDSGESVPIDEVAEIVGRGAMARTQTSDGDVAGFDDSLRAADVDGVIRSMLAAEEGMAHDPALRSQLRSMILQLADVAQRGLVEPRQVVGGFVELLLELRSDARREERYGESDRIRDGLAELGVEVRDTRDGAEWKLDAEAQNP
jgi:cyanophycinase-like exopeptidase